MTSGSFARGDAAELREKAKARKLQMQALDLSKLKQRAASGDLEGEFVAHLAKKLSADIGRSDAATKFLAEERKARAVVEVRRQLELKAAKAERQRQEAAEQHLDMLERLRRQQAKSLERAAEQQESRERVTRDIREQLAANEYRKMIEVELKEQEAALLSQAAARQAEKEAAVIAARRVEAVAQGRDIAEANRRFAVRDAARKLREEEDLQAVLRFQLDKAAKAAEEDRKRLAEKKEKERLAGEMLAQQKKAMDNSAAEDEAKARRHVEANIMKERARSEAAALKSEHDRREMIESVAAQLELKERKKVADRLKEAEDVARMQREMAEHIERDSARVHAAHVRQKQAQLLLVEQKLQRDADKAAEIRRPLEERRQMKLWEEAEKVAIDEFRGEVLERMKRDALPSVFTRKVSSFVPDHGRLHD